MSSKQFVQKGSLKGLEVYHDEVLGSLPTWFILFHGYGADANDLFGLYELLKTKNKFNFFCPQGPLEVPIGPGWTGRAWWNLDLVEMQRLALLGQERDFANENPPQLSNLRQKVLSSIEKIAPWEQIVLGGFSQGAMLATDIYLHAPKTPKGLSILSGTLLNQAEWTPRMSERKNEEVFMSHGNQDQVLKISGSEKLRSAFQQAGLKVQYYPFSGGHEIPMPILAKLVTYLDKKI